MTKGVPTVGPNDQISIFYENFIFSIFMDRDSATTIIDEFSDVR